MSTAVISHLLLALASLLQPEAPPADPKITNGYYRGAVFMFSIFMRVSGDTAFVDFVAWDKYPREVAADTLYYSEVENAWQGKYSVLISRDDKQYLRHREQSSRHILAPKADYRVKPEEKFDGRKVDSRNSAMLNNYYLNFLQHHATERERLLYYNTLYHMVSKRYNHDVFQYYFDKYRKELEEKIAAGND
jgi:hypothetical protein